MSSEPVFREEAVAQHAGPSRAGALLRLSSSWTRWSYWVVLLLLSVALCYSLVGQIAEYAVGPALVRAEGRFELTAQTEGTVSAVLVQSGETVAAGEPLVQLAGDEQKADLERIDKELELQLLKVLRDPSDQIARQSLSSLHAQHDLAAAHLERQLIRAPRAGTISDVRIRSGQRLRPGDVVLGLTRPDSALTVVALLPGRYRPMIQPGMPLRLELDGYRYAYRELDVAHVDDGVIGPAEAKRFLGPVASDVMEIDGSLTLVRARLPSRDFVYEGSHYQYSDGLTGTAHVRVKSERILLALVPGLRALFQHGR
ncbi:MAG TPA: HlyD family efflux transporter periplasmic adaptor subunit [Polyangia bacterium]